MKNALLATAAALALALPAYAQDEPQSRSGREALAQTTTPAPSPSDIVESAAPGEWVSIPAEDLLVMTLAPDADGNPREVIIQLMPAPFSQGWVENIRTLARAHWYDGISVNRVQDNYVVQWGDPGYDNPESGETEQKPLPGGLRVMGEEDYTTSKLLSVDRATAGPRFNCNLGAALIRNAMIAATGGVDVPQSFKDDLETGETSYSIEVPDMGDNYSPFASFALGWPIGGTMGNQTNQDRFWPVHCYGMVGVGRNYSPDTGTGAELYTVIGHAPRHLDRNIALVGRVIAGMEHLSSLPRGTGALGFYTEDEADKRTPILSVRVSADLPERGRREFSYLSTQSESFARYAEARANRRDPFFIHPAGGADICNIPVPIVESEAAIEGE